MAINKSASVVGPPTLTLVSVDNGQAALPNAHILLNGDFSRSGHDLVIRTDDGEGFVIEGFFSSPVPINLESPEGILISADTAARLAGPARPGQYAQAQAPSGQSPIGRSAIING